MSNNIKVSVILNAIADTKGFQVVNQELRAIEMASKRMKPTLDVMKNSFAGVSGVLVAAGAGLAGLVMQAIDSASQINDLSKATGISAESIQVLGHAATLNGTNIEEMSKAMVLLQTNALDAAKGNQVLIEKFSRLGISATDFAKLAPDQQIERFGRAVAGAKNHQEALAVAMDLVGAKNAPKLMQAFKALGEEGLDKFAQSARAAGVVMDNDVIDNLDEAGDRIETFKKRLTVIGAQIADTLLLLDKNGGNVLGIEVTGNDAVANALEERSNAVRDLGKNSLTAAEASIKLAKAFAEAGNTKMATGTLRDDGFFAALQGASGMNQDYLNSLTKMRSDVVNLIRQKNAEIHAATVAGNAQQKKDAEEALRAAAEAADTSKADFEDAIAAQERAQKHLEKIRADFDAQAKVDFEDAIEAEVRAQKAREKILAAAESMDAAYATPLEAAQATMKAAEELNKEGLILSSTYQRVGKALADATETERIEKLRKSLNPLQKAFADCANQIEGHLTDALTNMVMTGKLGMKELGQAILRDLVSALIRAQIVMPLMGAIAGATGMAGLFGAAPAAGAGAAPMAAPAAGGGYRDGSKPYLVGEEGPEIFNPGSGGTITPADVTAKTLDAANSGGGGGGGNTQVINLHFANGVTRSELAAQLPTMIKQIRDSVADSVRRGGAYRRNYA